VSKESADPERQARITWLGHSTVLVELDGTRVLTDPVLRDRVAHLRRTKPADAGRLPALNGILVSNLHHDHLDLPSLERLGRSVPVIVPRGGGGLLRRRRIERIVEVDAGEEVRIGGLVVRATPADHGGGRGFLGTEVAALGYLIRGSQRIYFAGDTDLFEGMATLSAGLDALRLFRPRLAVPIHWGTYAPLGFGRLQTALLADPVTEFLRHAAELAPEVEVCVLDLGGTLHLDAIARGDRG
jgi:L-ascorbate metabolism protein UlaG (beta-lactamase superfamily)